MMHALTLRLPVEYQVRGPGLPGVAFFAGDGQFAVARDLTQAPAAFRADVEASASNPDEQLFTDVIGANWALVWLSEEQLASGPAFRPADPRAPGEWPAQDEDRNAWDFHAPTVPIWLAERADPNTGVTPTDYATSEAGSPYEQALGYDDGSTKPWAEPLLGLSHLGGTTFHVQALPEGLTPFYLELEQFDDLDFGGDGNCQIDLVSGVFDWACG
jgi:hypothetical protein